MDLISIIVPCFNEEEALPLFYRELQRVTAQMKTVEFEMIFVDDGSDDGTLRWMRELSRMDERCRFLSFSRNFGKEAAMYAGMLNAKGDYVATMDADLQDPPSLLPQMYHAVREEGYECAAARRVTRKGEPRLRSFLSKRFYRLANRISKLEFMDGARDFRLMSQKMVQAVLELGEYNRFSKGLFSWVGFRTKWLDYENVERTAGKTKWPFGKLFLYALEGIAGFSTAPLMAAAVCGSVFCLLSFLVGIAGTVALFSGNTFLAGILFPTGLVLLVNGVQMLCSGISAWYLAKTYLEVKHRPVFILQETEEDWKNAEIKCPFEKNVPKGKGDRKYGTPA